MGDVQQELVDRGADPAATDPDLRATPRQWARFFHHAAVVALVDDRSGR